ncbi:MAG: hypothetical protein NT096_12585 [Proteobacteria bacterium]|nr:hypothetical protein [Pseudomonadota bacterium]
MDKDKLLEQVEMIYREIAEEDKRLCEDFLSISVMFPTKSYPFITGSNIKKDFQDSLFITFCKNGR